LIFLSVLYLEENSLELLKRRKEKGSRAAVFEEGLKRSVGNKKSPAARGALW
jgi:hypothetical protein